MAAERRRILFRYRRGDIVQKAGSPETWLVVRQRYETREIMPPFVQYQLRRGEVDLWVDEADIVGEGKPQRER